MPFWGSSTRPTVPGPFYIEKYPQGFQPLAAEASLTAAFNVVQTICSAIHSKKAAHADNIDLAIIDAQLKAIEFLVQTFQEAILNEDDITEAFGNFTRGMAELTLGSVNISNPEAHEAGRALADVLEITRKSIPSAFESVKKSITEKRNGLVEKIQAYDAVPAMRRETSSPTGTAVSDDSDDLGHGPPRAS